MRVNSERARDARDHSTIGRFVRQVEPGTKLPGARTSRPLVVGKLAQGNEYRQQLGVI
jgi:hypothetical protein